MSTGESAGNDVRGYEAEAREQHCLGPIKDFDVDLELTGKSLENFKWEKTRIQFMVPKCSHWLLIRGRSKYKSRLDVFPRVHVVMDSNFP